VNLRLTEYACLRCESRFPAELSVDSTGCPNCRAAAPANLFPVSSHDVLDSAPAEQPAMAAASSLWRYADALPVESHEAVSLGEGLTPLLHLERMGRHFGLERLFVKDEGRNPTWSHKDRFSTVMVSYARLMNAKVVATASSGNAGASLAAYAAAAGIGCVVSTFAATSGAMVSQARRYGATVIPFESKRDRWSFLAEGAKRHDWLIASPYHAPVVGSHPIGVAGYKTLAYEIVDQLGGPPDWCILPVCYGDALIGLWQGFKELKQSGRLDRLPKLAAAEVYGSLGQALKVKSDVLVDCPMPFETLAVSIGTQRSTFQALHALRQSGGVAVSVDNEELLDMQGQLARREGLFVELTSAAPLVAMEKLIGDGVIRSDERVVAIATASGLKDMDLSEGATITPVKPFPSIAAALAHVEERGF
jgi:threonine synthase